MKRTLTSLAALALAAVFLSGCTITYPAIARYTDAGEKFTGVVHASVFGGGDVAITSALSGTRCTGRAELTSAAFNCAGQSGTIHLQCLDGRTISGAWTATSCTSGAGTGQDQEGRPVEFAFGVTDAEVNEFLAP